MAGDLKNFAKGGGKMVFFVNDGPAEQVVKRLWAEGVLPARPVRFVRGLGYMQVPSRYPITEWTG
jgi:hypothetical protein